MVSDLRAAELALVDALEPIALQCPDGDFDWDTWLMVSDFEVRASWWCQANVAAPDPGFEPGVFNTFKAAAKAAAVRLGDHEGDVRAALVDVAKRARADDGSLPSWLSDHLAGCDQPELVATVQRAATWLERTLAVLDLRDFDRYMVDVRPSWDHPAGGVRLRGAIDLVEEGSQRPVVVVPSIDESRLDQAGFVSLLHGLERKGADDTIVLVSHSTGEVRRLERLEVQERAVAAAARAAAAVLARGSGHLIGLERRPSFFTCRDCHWAADCEPRLTHEGRPEVVRRGIRLA